MKNEKTQVILTSASVCGWDFNDIPGALTKQGILPENQQQFIDLFKIVIMALTEEDTLDITKIDLIPSNITFTAFYQPGRDRFLTAKITEPHKLLFFLTLDNNNQFKFESNFRNYKADAVSTGRWCNSIGTNYVHSLIKKIINL